MAVTVAGRALLRYSGRSCHLPLTRTRSSVLVTRRLLRVQGIKQQGMENGGEGSCEVGEVILLVAVDNDMREREREREDLTWFEMMLGDRKKWESLDLRNRGDVFDIWTIRGRENDLNEPSLLVFTVSL